MEMFLFQSQGPADAITLDPDGTALPSVAGGWKQVGSIGDLSAQLDGVALERLKKEGFLLLDKDQPRSMKADDWQPMSRGSFRLTDKALEQARSFLGAIDRSTGGRNILAFIWGPAGVKDKDASTWTELGMTLTLGAYPEADIPAAAVEYIVGIPFLFLFDPKILPTPHPTEIDFGSVGFVFSK